MPPVYNPDQSYALYVYSTQKRHWVLDLVHAEYPSIVQQYKKLHNAKPKTKLRVVGYPSKWPINQLPNPATRKELDELRRKQTWISKGQSISGTAMKEEIRKRLQQGETVRLHLLF